jgi:RNA polymerase sigma-70 factor, ECF subfamily
MHDAVCEPGRADSLLSRARVGQPGAFDELAACYRARIVRLAWRFVRDTSDAEDLAQEVLVKVWRHVGLFEGDDRLWAWVARITRNTAISRLRSCRRDARHVALDAIDWNCVGRRQCVEPADAAPWADQVFSQAQFLERAERALQTLPPSFRRAVRLMDFEDCSTKEASRSLGIPVPTVKSRAIRGRRLLRDALGAGSR